MKLLNRCFFFSSHFSKKCNDAITVDTFWFFQKSYTFLTKLYRVVFILL